MPPKDIPLSEKLLIQAKEFATQAGDKKLTNEAAIKSASVAIGTMLTQMNQESARLEFLRIKREAMLVAGQIATEQGRAEAAKFLLGHAVAASVLEDIVFSESNLDRRKLGLQADTIAQEIKKRLE